MSLNKAKSVEGAPLDLRSWNLAGLKGMYRFRTLGTDDVAPPVIEGPRCLRTGMAPAVVIGGRLSGTFWLAPL